MAAVTDMVDTFPPDSIVDVIDVPLEELPPPDPQEKADDDAASKKAPTEKAAKEKKGGDESAKNEETGAEGGEEEERVKRPLNAYMRYVSVVRSKVVEENPGMKVTDVVRLCALVCVCYF